ncbi:MAG: hypothetical protein ABIF08_02320 [Nanoarchaeota archaeon]
MARYSSQELWKQWQKAVGGALLALAVMIVFNHFLMALIVFTFLFFIPDQDEGAEFMKNTVIFVILMVIIWFFAFFVGAQYGGFQLDIAEAGESANPLLPWTWTDTSAIMFFVFWLFAGIVGAFGDPESRQIVGIFFIMMSFFVFASSVGAENVGSAFFGQWWPQVHGVIMDVSGPLEESFSTLFGTMQQMFKLVSDPAGFARDMIEGNYAGNDYGQTGSYGVEISFGALDKLFLGQPAFLDITLKNEGSFIAENVGIGISIPKEYTNQITSSPSLGEIDRDYFNLVDYYGFTESNNPGTEKLEIAEGSGVFDWNGLWWYNPGEVILYRNIGEMKHQDVVNQPFNGEINCNPIDKFNLREKSTPIKATVAYDYKVFSNLNIEFISVDEWDRRVRDNVLVQTKIPSTITSAPIKLSINTNSQPVRPDQIFYVGLELKTEETNSVIDDAVIKMTFPDEFGASTARCTGVGDYEFNSNELIWMPTNIGAAQSKPIGKEPVTIICTFYDADENAILGTSPTNTYNLKAEGTYRFYKWITRVPKLTMGDFCCKNEDCSSDGTEICSNSASYPQPGFCVPGDPNSANVDNPIPGACGNGIINSGEDCESGQNFQNVCPNAGGWFDKSDPTGATGHPIDTDIIKFKCNLNGPIGDIKACGCYHEPSDIPVATDTNVCGNGIVDAGEECDGGPLADFTSNDNWVWNGWDTVKADNGCGILQYCKIPIAGDYSIGNDNSGCKCIDF